MQNDMYMYYDDFCGWMKGVKQLGYLLISCWWYIIHAMKRIHHHHHALGFFGRQSWIVMVVCLGGGGAGVISSTSMFGLSLSVVATFVDESYCLLAVVVAIVFPDRSAACFSRSIMTFFLLCVVIHVLPLVSTAVVAILSRSVRLKSLRFKENKSDARRSPRHSCQMARVPTQIGIEKPCTTTDANTIK